MVRVVDEDVVALRGPEHGALRGLPISSQHREELRRRHVLARVRRLAAMINVLAVGLVEDLAGNRVLLECAMSSYMNRMICFSGMPLRLAIW